MKQELLVKLNSLYTDLEYEEDKATIRKIKLEIKAIEKLLNGGKDDER